MAVRQNLLSLIFKTALPSLILSATILAVIVVTALVAGVEDFDWFLVAAIAFPVMGILAASYIKWKRGSR